MMRLREKIGPWLVGLGFIIAGDEWSQNYLRGCRGEFPPYEN